MLGDAGQRLGAMLGAASRLEPAAVPGGSPCWLHRRAHRGQREISFTKVIQRTPPRTGSTCWAAVPCGHRGRGADPIRARIARVLTARICSTGTATDQPVTPRTSSQPP